MGMRVSLTSSLVSLSVLVAFTACLPPRRGGSSVTGAASGASGASSVAGPAIPWGSPTFVVRAAAPTGLDNRSLGAPLDAHFQSFAGNDGATLFAGARVVRTNLNQYDQRREFIDDNLTFEANARAWGNPTTETGSTSAVRYATYQVFQVDYVDTIDDTAPSRLPPTSGQAYLWKIYWGHAFEAVLRGPQAGFHSGIRARLSAATGDLRSFQRKERLDMDTHVKGFRPKLGEPVLMASAGEIGSHWMSEGPAVPIFVEYRGIPGRPTTPQPIVWAKSYRVDAQFTQIRIGNKGATAVEPKWWLLGSCEVNGQQFAEPTSVADGIAVNNGGVYGVTWRSVLPGVGPTDIVTCGTDGHVEDKSGTSSLARGRTPEIAIRLGPPQAGEFFAGDAKAGYAIGYTVSVTENP